MQQVEYSRKRGGEKKIEQQKQNKEVCGISAGGKKKVSGILRMKWLPVQLVIMFQLNISTALTNRGTQCSYT